ncbi:ADP-forming succinate--CoA ligase subunit beta [Candidatus Rariloculus sp.]|uniref:ADP-forming succinate--CoA ligase subunit beta n=1 Tax=Candidatus Rariloculus sp. TaxID=3101265 RepID=UPI003D11B735
MNLHEYQSKVLFREYGIPVPEGRVAVTPAEALSAAEALGGSLWVVKAQVHAGGRGKAGGVKLARSLDEVEAYATELLGKRLVTHQSGADGLPIDRVYVEGGSDIDRELYLSLVVDRGAERVAIVASAAGGMDIEEVARTTPEKIFTMTLHPAVGLLDHQARRIGFGLGVDPSQSAALGRILNNLVRLVHECDASLVEINPLIVTTTGEIVALDAKINVEDNALFRQRKLAALRDPAQEDDKERRAREHDLSYVSLDGNIACLVNGAGLAMATMDLIKLHGGEPANFLDVGGGATAGHVAEAFNIILTNKRVKTILVNIFGGIVRCDLIAEGVISGIRKTRVDLPVVVRLAGTNAEEGMELLANSGLDIIVASGLTDAATRAIDAAERVA